LSPFHPARGRHGLRPGDRRTILLSLHCAELDRRALGCSGRAVGRVTRMDGGAPEQGRHAIWRELVRRTRRLGGEWLLAAIAIAMPRLVKGHWHLAGTSGATAATSTLSWWKVHQRTDPAPGSILPTRACTPHCAGRPIALATRGRAWAAVMSPARRGVWSRPEPAC
jgi:hypothetical protein